MHGDVHDFGGLVTHTVAAMVTGLWPFIALALAVVIGVTVLKTLVAGAATRPNGPPRSRSRHRENDAAEDIARALVGAVIILAVTVPYLWKKHPLAVVAGLMVCAAVVAAMVVGAQSRRRRLRQHRLGVLALPAEYGKLDWREFEFACADLFRAMGCEARVTPAQGDSGADIVLSANGLSTVVQCKHYLGARKVGSPELQQLLGAMHIYKAGRAILVTTGELTQPALDLVAQVPALEVWQTERLVREAQAVIRRAAATPV